METIYVGLMSGTSQDGVDAVAVEFGDREAILLASHSRPFDAGLRQQLDELARGGAAELAAIGELDRRLGAMFSDAVLALLKDNPTLKPSIAAVGSHGHTAWHQPPTQSQPGFSMQLGDPNVIAARTGLTTVADFRRMDMAFGGHGAPLVPAFHQWLWAQPDKTQAIANIGGIANLTVLSGADQAIGFDTGPGNTLLDHWVQQHLRRPYDSGGAWSRSGTLLPDLLSEWLADPYFQASPPKSTGREYFNLERCLGIHAEQHTPADVARTLLELTARSLGDAVQQHAGDAESVVLVGGGSHNEFLRERLAETAARPVTTSESLQVPADWVEAMAFAWLAQRRLAGLPGNLPSVTGAHQSTVLGGVYSPN
jgi:anhydro-N-acetylmuramic acid kinase